MSIEIKRLNVEAELTLPSGLISSVRELSNAEYDELMAKWRTQFQDIRRPALVTGSVAYWSSPDPALPAWLTTPYAGRNACYGCGLEPEVMNPGQWILCTWCDELRAVLADRR